jgi:hypothetical protein
MVLARRRGEGRKRGRYRREARGRWTSRHRRLACVVVEYHVVALPCVAVKSRVVAVRPSRAMPTGLPLPTQPPTQPPLTPCVVRPSRATPTGLPLPMQPPPPTLALGQVLSLSSVFFRGVRVEVSFRAVRGAEGRNSLEVLPGPAQTNSLLQSKPFF